MLEQVSKTQTAYAFRKFLSFYFWPLNHRFFLVYKRGKATPLFGSFHGSDVPEFYASTGPNGTAPDFIGTDALGMFLNLAFH